MGTCTGLTKMPYIRDGRRSLAVDDFIMTLNNTAELYDAPDCAAIVGHARHRYLGAPYDGTPGRQLPAWHRKVFSRRHALQRLP